MNLNDLKTIQLHEIVNHEFSSLAHIMSEQLLNPTPQSHDAYGGFKADQHLLALEDDVQDMYWLYSLGRFADITKYFQSRESDFAPYILRALQRQNLSQLAQQFSQAINEFEQRFDGFDPQQKTIIAFKIPATEEELDQAFINGLNTLGSSPEEKAYIETKKQQRASAKAHNRLLQEFGELDYGQLYYNHPKLAAVQKKLENFSSQEIVFATIANNLHQKPNLLQWYEGKIKNLNDETRFKFLKDKLIAMAIKSGTRQGSAIRELPEIYQDIFSLLWLNMEASNGGLGQYFFNTQGEDSANLLKVFDENGEKNLSLLMNTGIHLFKQAYRDQLPTIAADKTVISTSQFDNWDDFEMDIDLSAILQDVENLMYSIAIEHSLLPQ